MIDTHCHLLKQYYESLDEVINRMKDNIMIVSGTNDKDIIEILELTKKYHNIYATVGIHPTDVEKVGELYLIEMEKILKEKKVIAIGEIGLDFYHKTDRNKQLSFFIKQLDLAREYKMPVVIHCRDAIEETLEIVKLYKDLKMSFHCFSGSVQTALELIKMGFRLGFAGPLTFKNNVKTKEVIKNIPLESILIETDSPFLTPEPLRGTKNEPYNVIYIANEIASLRGLSLNEVLKITSQNAIEQFDLPIKL